MTPAILTRLLLLRLIFPRETSKHQADHRNGEHRLATLDGSFILFRQPTILYMTRFYGTLEVKTDAIKTHVYRGGFSDASVIPSFGIDNHHFWSYRKNRFLVA